LADIRKIKRRIKGVQNISKITRAMEMIAASQMRKAQERGLRDGLTLKKSNRLSQTWRRSRKRHCSIPFYSGVRKK